MKTKLLTLCLALVCATQLFANGVIIDGINYSLSNYGDKIASVTYQGSSAEEGNNYSGTIIIPSSVTYQNETYSVTTIGRYAFQGCSSLTSVTIPNSVTTIGENAFYGCSGLTSVTIPNSVTTIGSDAFYYCKGLTSITIPNSVTTIGSAAFFNCSRLTSVTIPNSVTTIGNQAFDACGGLKKTNYTGTIADWCKIKFDGTSANPICHSQNFYINDVEVKDLVIPDGLDMIGDYAFYGCSGLTSVTIPNSVTTIGNQAFDNCSGLASINVDVGNAHYCSIDGVLFNYAKDTLIQCPAGNERTEYTIPNSVTTIGNQAFDNCSGLASVTIGSSVTTIGNRAFYYCKGLTSITIPNSVTSIGRNAFSYCGLTSPAYNANCFAYMPTTYKGAYTIPDGIKQIAGGAFNWCSGLTSVTIPNSVTTIGESAFNQCNYLKKTNYTGTIADWCKIKFGSGVDNPTCYSHNFYINDVEVTDLVIPEGVDTIGEYAFMYCKGLTSVTIPSSVTLIGYYAFYNCNNLKIVNVYSNSNLNIQKGEFSNGCVAYYAEKVYTIIGDFIIDIDNTILSQYLGTESSVSIPNYITEIGSSAFANCSTLTSIVIPNNVTTISNSAFANCTYLADVIIGANVTEIGCNAFAGDIRIENITCYAPLTPNVCNTTFSGITKSVVYLFVPADYQRKYQVDPNWKDFDLHLIGAEKTQTGDKVTVTPSVNEATFVWPSNNKADSYSLEITKDSVVFCTLKFNAIGQLTGIAFAPGRGHTAMAHTANPTGAGWQFTVTGLNQASKYAYTLDALNASQQSIKHYQGEFVTDGYTDLLPLPYEGKDGIGSVKFIHNGRLLIIRNGILYDAHGARVK